MYTSGDFPFAVRLHTIRETLSTMSIWGNSRSAAICMAASAIFVLPMLIMYMILQKKFIKSIDRVGITG